MHDSERWYCVRLRLFRRKGKVLGDLHVTPNDSRSVIGTVADPRVSSVPPRYTRVILK